MTHDVATPAKSGRRDSFLTRGLRWKPLPGLAVAVAAVAAAWLLHLAVPMLPFLTIAVMLGILSANLPKVGTSVEGVLQPGLTLAGRRFMRMGIVLLGLKLSLVDVVALGWKTVGIVVCIVLLTFVGTLLLGKALGLPGHQPLLLATGFSICGASAIGAMGGATKTDHRDTVVPIALVTLCGTLAIGVLPALRGMLGLNDVEFGHWVGASVHDVGQVVATAQTAGTAALAGALIIKLTRVLMLAPMVMGASFVERRRSRCAGASSEQSDAKLPPLVPLFVAGFVAAIILRTFGILPPEALQIAGVVQDVLLAAALFGLGASVQIHSLLKTGGRAVLAAMLSWALIAAVAYLGVRLI